MRSLPKKLSGNGELARAINALIDCLAERTPLEGKNIRLELRPNGFHLMPLVNIGGGRGAGPYLLYDKDASYAPGTDVVVPPNHELVTDGLRDEETDEVRKSPAGLYRCQKSVSPVDKGGGIFAYNAPKWPLESVDDLEAASTFWMLTALYPTLVQKCVENPEDSGGDLIESEFYENTQPVPETEA